MGKRIGAVVGGAKHGSYAYVPDAGHLIWLSFSPQAGREQGGRRPALVLSPRLYNMKAGLCIVCPVTTQAKQYPFEVKVPDDLAIAGVILSDHVKSADWRSRRAEFVAVAPDKVIAEVRAKLRPLMGI